MATYAASELPKRKETVEKLKAKMLNEINAQILDHIDWLKVIPSEKDTGEDLRREVLELSALYALQSFVNWDSSFNHVVQSTAEYTIFTISDITLDIMLEDNWDNAVRFLVDMIPLEKIFSIDSYLDDRFFEFEFVSILDRCVYKDKHPDWAKESH